MGRTKNKIGLTESEMTTQRFIVSETNNVSESLHKRNTSAFMLCGIGTVVGVLFFGIGVYLVMFPLLFIVCIAYNYNVADRQRKHLMGLQQHLIYNEYPKRSVGSTMLTIVLFLLAFFWFVVSTSN